MKRPHASTHYPESLGEFQAWFPTDADSLVYLEWLRWPCGFVETTRTSAQLGATFAEPPVEANP